MSTCQLRQPAGAPTGGQFATATRAVPDITLANGRPTETIAAELAQAVPGAFSLEVEGPFASLYANAESDMGIFARHDPDVGPVFSIGYGPELLSDPWREVDDSGLVAEIVSLDEWEESQHLRGRLGLSHAEVASRQTARASAAAPHIHTA